MSALFERDRSVIGKHIRKIYQEKELDENRTRAKNARHLEDGRIFQVDVYNLDVIIVVGYRVNSKRGTLFRQWANKILKEYLLKGYVINDERTLITNDNYARLIKKEFELELNVSPKEETIWMTASQMALLFGSDEKTIRKHINNIFVDKELEYFNNTQKMRVVGVKQSIHVYNLNVIISVGYRVKSNRGTIFRIWANKVHDRYIIIDRDKLYHLEHSIKDLGKKISTISESDKELIKELLTHLN